MEQQEELCIVVEKKGERVREDEGEQGVEENEKTKRGRGSAGQMYIEVTFGLQCVVPVLFVKL